MTEPELRRRAKLFMAELAIADAVAGVAPRTSSPDANGARPLVDALQRFLQRYAPTETWTRWTEVFNAYAAAYKRGSGDWTFTEHHGAGPDEMLCNPCSVSIEFRGRGFGPKWNDGPQHLLDHVLSVAHLARAEGRLAKARAS